MVNPMVDDSMKFSRVKPDVFGDAHPKALLKRIQEDGDQLQVLANQHIVSVEQFDAMSFDRPLALVVYGLIYSYPPFLFP